MRGLEMIGIILTIMGIALAATTGFSFEESKALLSTQNVDASIKAHPTNNWPWAAGIVAVVGGAALLILKANKKKRENRKED